MTRARNFDMGILNNTRTIYTLTSPSLTFTDDFDIGRLVVLHTVGKATDSVRVTGWLTALLDLLQIGLWVKQKQMIKK